MPSPAALRRAGGSLGAFRARIARKGPFPAFGRMHHGKRGWGSEKPSRPSRVTEEPLDQTDRANRPADAGNYAAHGQPGTDRQRTTPGVPIGQPVDPRNHTLVDQSTGQPT